MKAFKLLLIFLLLTSTCYAKTICYDGVDIEMSDKYSGKGYPYHDVSLKGEKMKDINIYGSCFYQYWRESEIMKDIFPDDMEGVTFYNCNLDNVYVDEIKNTIIGGSHRAIKEENDWSDWEQEYKLGKWQPKEPLDKEQRLKTNISIKPEDIPNEKWTREERDAFENTLNNADIQPIP